MGPLTFRAEYQYEGDLSKLPAPVWADDDETTPPAVAEPSVKSKAVEPVTEEEPAEAAESSSGAFDAFLAEPG